MTTLLDVSALPHDLIWNEGATGAVSLAAVGSRLKATIHQMIVDGVIADRESFGYALANPNANLSTDWDDPHKLIGLVMYWGPEGPRYAANACRKIRPAAREGKDTEAIRQLFPNLFRDKVESNQGDTEFPWGDFPWDGAAYTIVQGRKLLGAVSAYPKEQDPVVARLVTGVIGHAMWSSDEELRQAA